MYYQKLFFLAFMIGFSNGKAYSQNPMLVATGPSTIFLEQGEYKQIINFDFLISNKSKDTISLDKLTVSVFDKENNLLQKRFLDNNGTAPGIFTLPKRVWDGEMSQLIFNPFPEFEIMTPISRLEYELVFSNKDRQEFTVSSIVNPVKYVQQSKLCFPLKGRILVYDAHDYTSHHRRFDYTFPLINELGLKTNFMRYAYDFVILNKENQQFSDKGEKDSDYFGYGHTIHSVAAGKVIYVAATHKDDKNFDVPKLKENPLELYGNCIAIQHADSSISIYGHLKENSITVKTGDNVKANQAIAQIGVSGSSFFPHLHFEIRTSITHTAEGLPSYFRDIRIVEGKLIKKTKTGLVETGIILEAK